MSLYVGDVWHKYQRAFASKKYLLRFLVSHYLSFPGEVSDVTNYLKMILGMGQEGVGAEFCLTLEGNLELALLVLINQRACLYSGCAKESSCF